MRLRFAICLAAALPAAAENLDPIDDFRLGITVQQPLTISEVITPSGGTGKTYNWKGGKRFGTRFDAEYDQGMSRRQRALPGFLWSVGVSYSNNAITPDSYDTGSGTSTNSREDQELNYRQYGLMGGLGWATMPTSTSMGNYHFEISAIGRGGWSTAQSTSPGLTPEIGEGHAPYWEAGGRGGLMLCDEHWLFGITLGWLYGRNKIDIDLPGGYSSQMTIIRNGAEAAVQIGFRF